MVKRMQHGFASRNGLTATALVASGCTGIKAAPRSDRILMAPAVVQRNITTRPWRGWRLTQIRVA